FQGVGVSKKPKKPRNRTKWNRKDSVSVSVSVSVEEPTKTEPRINIISKQNSKCSLTLHYSIYFLCIKISKCSIIK
ncbi:hypothetical protein GIB67_039433, partial [Kingdonia uniflora]